MKRKLKRGKIESIYKLTMPELFDTSKVIEVETLPSWEKYTYYLVNPLPLEQVMDFFEEQNNLMFLYHYNVQKAVIGGDSCCFVSVPEMDHMVKIQAASETTGLCYRVHLTIYHSVDTMIDDITHEYNKLKRTRNFNFDDTYSAFIRFFA